ncbi:metallophosphoesterase family protein [Salinarimonas soli]|uniref:Serine/threonine protein phosphatase n=1 Tax=Salinarimonas soli TaxID=1638099 RepID=A0A5B2V735_9HYPH|nr:metallophosphoesterase family protein [Salinarimonas soli]KAA2234771.1 serine/threonine protein phosphatase [Salinarimonas soli]
MSRWKIFRRRPERVAPPPPARVPDGVRVYAVGDIHGRADLLDAVLSRIDRHRAESGPAQCFEVFLGDYIDRGPNSRGTIERLIERSSGRHSRVVTLCGNHEDMLLEALRNPERLNVWARNGGFETLMSYGVTVPARITPATAEAVVEEARALLPVSHRQFLFGLGDSFRCGDYLFVHAGVRPGVPLDRQSRSDLLWIRDEFIEAEEDFGAIVVHGHTPVREIEFRSNRINIDTGAYITNTLNCLVLEGSDAIAL